MFDTYQFYCGLLAGWISMAGLMALLMTLINKKERKRDGKTNS